MVFKKRALGFSANISWLSSKALFAYTAACIYWREKEKGGKKKSKPIQTDHFGTINSYMVILCWHIITSLLSIGSKYLSLINSFTMDFDQRGKYSNHVWIFVENKVQ